VEIPNELKVLLKTLKLSPLQDTLPERVTMAKASGSSYLEFLELVLTDEVERRKQGALQRRLKNARVTHDEVLERFDWDSEISVDKDKLKALVGLDWVERHENVIFTGPVGVGKTYLANSLAHAACRRGWKVLMLKASKMFKILRASRADNSLDRELTRFITPKLLVIDDFGLEGLTPEQTRDFYEIVCERYERGSIVMTSNRHISEWLKLFDDEIIANSAMDRLAHAAHQIVIEGQSYRKKKASKKGLV
jgi:DNA replication protein DnaC